jgi:hypothetical protein
MIKEISLIALVALGIGALFLGTSLAPAFAQRSGRVVGDLHVADADVSHGELGNVPHAFLNSKTIIGNIVRGANINHASTVGNVPHGGIAFTFNPNPPLLGLTIPEPRAVVYGDPRQASAITPHGR